jgi:hypothetical protein
MGLLRLLLQDLLKSHPLATSRNVLCRISETLGSRNPLYFKMKLLNEIRSDRADPATLAGIATKRTSRRRYSNGGTPPAPKPVAYTLAKEATYSQPPDYLDNAEKHGLAGNTSVADLSADDDPDVQPCT